MLPDAPLPFGFSVEKDGVRWTWAPCAWTPNGAQCKAVQQDWRVEARRHRPLTCRIIAQPHPRPPHDPARRLRRLRHPLSTCHLASRLKEYMTFLCSLYVADDIGRIAYSRNRSSAAYLSARGPTRMQHTSHSTPGHSGSPQHILHQPS